MRNLIYRSSAMLSVMLAMVSLAYSFEVDDTLPEVTDRVARISFVSGNVQIKRAEVEDWEKADLNLPVVEGDEIVTEADGRIEIQFNANTHLRLDGNSTLQIKQLTDGGIAVSISRGLGSVRVRKFDSDKEFFEIDAPGTTVALQKEGTYKFDAGQNGSLVRVGIRDGGEARVYSANAGFTLRSGRAARLFITGDFAGESDTRDISEFTDAFDTWTADRDDVIAKNLDKAHYGRYYDQDIYAAEELSDYGDWQFTDDYGYVWQPNTYATRGYADWSPYRYGSWRWVPAFGWTWVNDEPWGWATYHHGRWIMYRGRWVWAPYGYYRSARSWWHPALVVVQVYNNNICWYPMGYRGRYRDYHGWNRGRRGRDRDPHPGPQQPQPQPSRTPKPMGKYVPVDDDETRGGPITGVIVLPKEDFGTGNKIGKKADEPTTKGILIKRGTEPTSELPQYEKVKPTMGPDIIARAPVSKRLPMQDTGATQRTEKAPLDVKLRQTRFYGDRQPTTAQPQQSPPFNGSPVESQAPRVDNGRVPKNTGAVERPPRSSSGFEPTKQPDVQPETGRAPRVDPPVRRDPPIRQPEMPRDEPIRKEIPRQEPRTERPVQKEVPRYEPPPRRETPPPRNDPPPRRDPPPSPPPSKSEPKSSPPPSKQPDSPAPSRKGKG